MRFTKERTTCLMLALLALPIALAGCSQKAPEEAQALPSHPFPRWVSQLEIGVTPRESVRALFGEPDVIERHGPSSRTWTYSYSEIHWTRDDPDRPQIAADGQPILDAPPGFGERIGDAFASFGHAFERLLYYPGPRVPTPRLRTLPATRHHLELVFDEQDLLTRYLYAPRPDLVRVPVAG